MFAPDRGLAFDTDNFDGLKSAQVHLNHDDLDDVLDIRAQIEPDVVVYNVDAPEIIVNLIVFVDSLLTTERPDTVFVRVFCNTEAKVKFISDFGRQVNSAVWTTRVVIKLYDTNGNLQNTGNGLFGYRAYQPNSPDATSIVVRDVTVDEHNLQIPVTWIELVNLYHDQKTKPAELRAASSLSLHNSMGTEYLALGLARTQMMCALLRLDGWGLVQLWGMDDLGPYTATLKLCRLIGNMQYNRGDDWFSRQDAYTGSTVRAFIEACTETKSGADVVDDSSSSSLAVTRYGERTNRSNEGRSTVAILAVNLQDSCWGMYPVIDTDLIVTVRNSRVKRFDLKWLQSDISMCRIVSGIRTRRIPLPERESQLTKDANKWRDMFNYLTENFRSLGYQDFTVVAPHLIMSSRDAEAYEIYLKWKTQVSDVLPENNDRTVENITAIKDALFTISDVALAHGEKHVATGPIGRWWYQSTFKDVIEAAYDQFVDIANGGDVVLDPDRDYRNLPEEWIFYLSREEILEIVYTWFMCTDVIDRDDLHMDNATYRIERSYLSPDARYQAYLAYRKFCDVTLFSAVFTSNLFHIPGILHMILQFAGEESTSIIQHGSSRPSRMLSVAHLMYDPVTNELEKFNSYWLKTQDRLKDSHRDSRYPIQQYIMHGKSTSIQDATSMTVRSFDHMFAVVAHVVSVSWTERVPLVWQHTILADIWFHVFRKNKRLAVATLRTILDDLMVANSERCLRACQTIRFFIIFTATLYERNIDLAAQNNLTALFATEATDQLVSGEEAPYARDNADYEDNAVRTVRGLTFDAYRNE